MKSSFPSLQFLAVLCLLVFICSPSSCAPVRGKGKVEIQEQAHEVGATSTSHHLDIPEATTPVDTVRSLDVGKIIEQYPVKTYKKEITSRTVLNQFVEHMQALTTSIKRDQMQAHRSNQIERYNYYTNQLISLKPYVKVLKDAHEYFQISPLTFIKGNLAALRAEVNDNQRNEKIGEISENVNVIPRTKALRSSLSFIENFKPSWSGSSSSSSNDDEADFNV